MFVYSKLKHPTPKPMPACPAITVHTSRNRASRSCASSTSSTSKTTTRGPHRPVSGYLNTAPSSSASSRWTRLWIPPRNRRSAQMALLRRPMCGLKLSIKVWYRHCYWKLLSVRPSCTCFSIIPRIRFRQASFFIFLNSTDSLGLSWLPRALLDTLLTIASQCRQ